MLDAEMIFSNLENCDSRLEFNYQVEVFKTTIAQICQENPEINLHFKPHKNVGCQTDISEKFSTLTFPSKKKAGK